MNKFWVSLALLSVFLITVHAQTTDDEKYEQANTYYEAKEYEEAIPILKELADKNHAKALCLLGFLYERGYGVKQDIIKSLEYTKKSAELGWMVAQHNLGYYFETGFGVEKDYAKAFELYMKAAEQGYSKSITNIGWFYDNGYFVEKDIDKAVKYYLEAAKNGETQAMINLGWAYNNSDYQKNHIQEHNWEYYDKQAEMWLRKAALNNNAKGIYNLACFYYNYPSNDIWANLEKSAPLFEKAAKMNYGDAQLFMGIEDMRKGELKSAMNWFILAAENGGTEQYGLKTETWQMLCNFFIKNPQYKFYWNNDCCIIDFYIYPEEDYFYVGATEKGKFGFLKLSNTGTILAKTPFKYEQDWPSYNAESKLFYVETRPGNRKVYIDITGKEIIKEP